MSRSNGRQVPNLTRRHLVAVAGTAVGQAMALASAVMALSSTIWPSSAKAHGHEHREGRGGGCFVRGTHIRTPQGEARIEDLQIGDLVVTMRGAAAIKWIGRNTHRKNGSAWRKDITPLRVSCCAIEDNLPCRDLYLSPGHGLFIDGFLIPVQELANGVSIIPVVPLGAETIEYFQIDTEAHEVIFAEDVPIETHGGGMYLTFDNFAEYKRLYPNDCRVKTPAAPNLGTWQAHLSALVGVGKSYFIEVVDPLQIVYERIAARAEQLKLAA